MKFCVHTNLFQLIFRQNQKNARKKLEASRRWQLQPGAFWDGVAKNPGETKRVVLVLLDDREDAAAAPAVVAQLDVSLDELDLLDALGFGGGQADVLGLSCL